MILPILLHWSYIFRTWFHLVPFVTFVPAFRKLSACCWNLGGAQIYDSCSCIQRFFSFSLTLAAPNRSSTFGRTQFCLPFCHQTEEPYNLITLSAWSAHWNTLDMLLIYFGYLADMFSCAWLRCGSWWPATSLSIGALPWHDTAMIYPLAVAPCHCILLWHARTAFRPCSISWRRFSNILVRHISRTVFDVLETALNIFDGANVCQCVCDCRLPTYVNKGLVVVALSLYWSYLKQCARLVMPLCESYLQCLPCLPCLMPSC